MINCAHPSHFESLLASREPWQDRIRGLRANASTKSHAELDEATELDEGDPADLGARYAALRTGLPQLNVLGGCCGNRPPPRPGDLRGVVGRLRRERVRPLSFSQALSRSTPWDSRLTGRRAAFFDG